MISCRSSSAEVNYTHPPFEETDLSRSLSVSPTVIGQTELSAGLQLLLNKDITVSHVHTHLCIHELSACMCAGVNALQRTLCPLPQSERTSHPVNCALNSTCTKTILQLQEYTVHHVLSDGFFSFCLVCLAFNYPPFIFLSLNVNCVKRQLLNRF